MKKINTINIPFYEFNSGRELAEEVLADSSTTKLHLKSVSLKEKLGINL